MNNRRKSRIRCRIEHIFGFMTGAMHGITVRSIGIIRAWMIGFPEYALSAYSTSSSCPINTRQRWLSCTDALVNQQVHLIPST